METADQMYKGPDGTAVRFFQQPTLNNFQTEKAGRPVYDTSLMAEVMVPGMRESTPQIELERTLCEEHGLDPNGQRHVKRSPRYDEFREAIEAFKRQSGEGLISGTPIGQWSQIDPGTAATLKAAGVHTVEQLAEVSDGNIAHIGIGGTRLREMAQQFLQTRTFGLPSAQMASENATLKARVLELEQQLVDARSALANAAPAVAPAPAVLADPVVEAPAVTDPFVLGDATPPPPVPAPTVDPFAPSPPLVEQPMFAPATEPLI